jgi:hypothetical protein
MVWLTRSFGGVEIAYRQRLDSGGAVFGQACIRRFRALNVPKQWRILEWCAGPGFIGFSLLVHGNVCGPLSCRH